MSELIPSRRVLLVATEPARREFRPLFQTPLLHQWHVIEADSLERARFLSHLDPCDVLLLDCSLYPQGGSDDLTWLAAPPRVPVLLLSDGDAETVADALRQGAHYWLPRELARDHVAVLAAMLRQAAEFGDMQRRGQETATALEDARRRVSRLVNLLWEAAPGEGRARWFTQRYMLERLAEEVNRAQRYGGSLAVVLGEVAMRPDVHNVGGEDEQPATAIIEQISSAKRRCDVAGQYGMQGFMLILPQTDEEGATSCCRRLRPFLEKPTNDLPSVPSRRVQFGIAGYTPQTRSISSLLSRAEEQLERGSLAIS